jgi:hypothetical protein
MKDLSSYELLVINGGGDGLPDPEGWNLKKFYEDCKKAWNDSIEFLKSDTLKDFGRGFVDGLLGR